MNIKISSELHDQLSAMEYKEYLYGSQLHGINNTTSDFDYIRVISNHFYDSFQTLAIFLPNIHSWQFENEKKTQFVWMTEKQFYHSLFSGDGNMIADVVLLSGEFENVLFLCRTYKIIKGYLGVAKRDLKMHGDMDKKKFHAIRSMFMAEKLMNNEVPSVQDIKTLYKNTIHDLPSKETLLLREQEMRNELNNMLNQKQITMYPFFDEPSELHRVLLNSNNLTEFRYN